MESTVCIKFKLASVAIPFKYNDDKNTAANEFDDKVCFGLHRCFTSRRIKSFDYTSMMLSKATIPRTD